MANNPLPTHMTKGGPGDAYLGDGKVDTSSWFKEVDLLEEQIRNQEIWFCTAPFQMIYTDTDGTLAPCSWAVTRAKMTAPNVRRNKFATYFVEDEELNEMRKEMTTPGSDLKTCERICVNCRRQEKLYGRSRRQASLKIQSNDPGLWPEIRKAVEIYKETGKGRIQNRVFEVQIKAFGNQCNLDCFMCIPDDSSTRLKTINSDKLKDEQVFHPRHKTTPISLLKRGRLEEIVDEIVAIAPYIYNLKFIGGEPLVMKQFYTLLEKIVASGHSKNMRVKYQTNMSVLEFERVKVTKFIPEFELFEFTVSLDGIGKANNYIRRRSDWDNIVNNIKTVKKYPNVEINVNGTISFLSVLRFYELIEWFQTNELDLNQINWSNIRNPKKLMANVLPIEIKEKLLPKYEGFSDIQNILKEDNGGLDYQDSLNYLIMMDNYYLGTKWELHLFDVYPELEKYHNRRAS